MRPLALIALASVALVACEEAPPPRYEYGMVLDDLELQLISDTVGVWPDRSVIFDPNNPFRSGISVEGKFEAFRAGHIAGFYGFASALANEPTGENQYYTARSLADVHRRRLADPDDLALVRQLAIAGFQNVLDEFTGAISFTDATARTPIDLMPLAIIGIEELGATPANGWKLVEIRDETGAVVDQFAFQSGVTE